jgi:hypothetical protein
MILFFLLAMLWAVPAVAAPVFNAAGATSAIEVDTATVGVASSGSNRLLVACLAANEGNTVSAFTYNSVALTAVTDLAHTGEVALWMRRLIAPDTGTNDLAVLMGAAVSTELTIGGMTFTGVDQTTPLDAEATNSGVDSAGSVDVVSGAVDDLAAGCLVSQGDTPDSVTAGDDERFSAGSFAETSGVTQTGAASVTLDWSWLASHRWLAIGASINPVAGAPASGSRRIIVIE